MFHRVPRGIAAASSLAAALVLSLSSSAHALPSTSVSWVQQTGTIHATDTVEVWLRLAVDAAASEPLIFDGTGASLSPQDTQGFSRVDQVSGNAGVYCNANFFPPGSCGNSTYPWVFDFNHPPGTSSFYDNTPFTIAAGAHKDFLLGRFLPQNGPVAPGIYRLVNAELLFYVSGIDLNGAPMERSISLGEPCRFHNPSCIFNREVLAVPEPETYALMLAGLGIVGAAALRRRR